MLAYLLLAAVLAAAAGALVFAARQPPEPVERAWSPWRPAGDDETEYPAQIARHVASKYRLPSGNPLVSVIAQVPQLQIQGQAVPIGWLVVEGTDGPVPAETTYMYVLCGRGENCSITEGRPSRQRLRALRREALELALYTFEYVGPVDSVLTLMPNTADGTPIGALFHRESDLEHELEDPLAETLGNPEGRKPPRVHRSEVATVERLTTPYLFSYDVQQAPDGSAVFVLGAAPPE